MIVTVFIIATLTFFLMNLIPGSPFNEERTTNAVVQQNLEEHYHLHEPLAVQYVLYLKSIITLDFGPSIKQPTETVNALLGRGFPISAELGIWTVLIALISGVALGVFAALKHNHVIDYMAMTIAVLGISIPNFVLATMLIQQLAVQLEWLPAATWSSPAHMVLPVLALATGADGDHRQADTVKYVGNPDPGLHKNRPCQRAFSLQDHSQTCIEKCPDAGGDHHGDASSRNPDRNVCHRKNICDPRDGQIFRRRDQPAGLSSHYGDDRVLQRLSCVHAVPC